MRTEGDGATRLLELLRGPRRQDTTVLTGTVMTVNPLSIRLPGYRDNIPEEALVVAEILNDREMEVQLSPSEPFTIIKVRSKLREGDSVICALVDDGQLIYVLDREAN